MGLFRDINVSNNREYKKRYRNYWAMNAAMLTPDFIDTYFILLEEYKNTEQINPAQICHELYEVPANKKGDQKVQFSFATKLVHMVTPTLPIYDKMVKEFYFLPDPSGTTIQRKLFSYMTIYDFLKEEYQRILDNNLLAENIQVSDNISTHCISAT